MKFSVHLLAYNEARFIRWALRHWLFLTPHVCVHDLGSTDDTPEIALSYGARLVEHDTKDETNDLLNKGIKESCWKQDGADWVAVVDCDELLFWPGGFLETLAAYDRASVAVVKPHGWEMFSETAPQEGRKLEEQVTMGSPADYWYGKPVLFSPRRVRHIEFSCGAHSCMWWGPRDAGNRFQQVRQTTTPTKPATALCHFHHIWPIADIAADYDAHVARMSETNRRMKWGWQGDGMEHALEKRKKIMSDLHQVFPG